MTVRWIAAVTALAATGAAAQTDLATAFGAREQIEQISLSPDGTRLAYVVPTAGQGSALLTFAPGVDKEPKVAFAMNGEPDRLSDCNWIANDRLVCGIWGLAQPAELANAGIIPYSRVVAIDAGGGNPRMLSAMHNSNSRGYNLRGGEVIDWLPEEELAAVGWSYGGYAALQSAVVDPALFKAIVAIAPVTDLPLLKEQSRWWSNYRLVSDFIGSGAQVLQGSPARNAAQIKAPVMLFHGTMDRNVNVEQTRVMDRALTAAGVPHRTVIFENRDHQIEDGAMRARMLRDSDTFLRQSMGM